MKLHPLAQGDFQGMIVKPVLPGGQAWPQGAIWAVLNEGLDNVPHDRDAS
ncbi:MAG TPA: hypothetical protein VIH59_25175 [Candidatus Tectomicrobia bacterium]